MRKRPVRKQLISVSGPVASHNKAHWWRVTSTTTSEQVESQRIQVKSGFGLLPAGMAKTFPTYFSINLWILLGLFFVSDGCNRKMGTMSNSKALTELTDEGTANLDNEVDSSSMSVNCFGLPMTASNILKFFFKPHSRETVNTTFFLYSRKNKMTAEHITDVKTSGIDMNIRTVLIIHGFMSTASEEWVTEMASSLLKRENVNVIAVDWSGGGNTWKYWRAVANTRVAGKDVGRFLKTLISNGMKPMMFHLIGHSLGAHICSFASAIVGGVARITGLDPAQPCFDTDDLSMKLDPSDAVLVDVIHTNGKLMNMLGFGVPNPLGHADFYPNGGMCQPGCYNGLPLDYPLPGAFDFIKSLVTNVKDVMTAICSHGRAYKFFTKSVLHTDCSFWALKWDHKLESIPDVEIKPCNVRNCSEMGLSAEFYPARGIFYVKTNESHPYCIPDHVRDWQIAESLLQLHENITAGLEPENFYFWD